MVRDVSQHGRVEEGLAHQRQHERRAESDETRPQRDESHGRRHQPRAEQHPEPAAARLDEREQERGRRADDRAIRHQRGDRRQVHAQAAREDRQERVDHPMRGVQDHADEGEDGEAQRGHGGSPGEIQFGKHIIKRKLSRPPATRPCKYAIRLMSKI